MPDLHHAIVGVLVVVGEVGGRADRRRKLRTVGIGVERLVQRDGGREARDGRDDRGRPAEMVVAVIVLGIERGDAAYHRRVGRLGQSAVVVVGVVERVVDGIVCRVFPGFLGFPAEMIVNVIRDAVVLVGKLGYLYKLPTPLNPTASLIREN